MLVRSSFFTLCLYRLSYDISFAHLFFNSLSLTPSTVFLPLILTLSSFNLSLHLSFILTLCCPFSLRTLCSSIFLLTNRISLPILTYSICISIIFHKLLPVNCFCFLLLFSIVSISPLPPLSVSFFLFFLFLSSSSFFFFLSISHLLPLPSLSFSFFFFFCFSLYFLTTSFRLKLFLLFVLVA